MTDHVQLPVFSYLVDSKIADSKAKFLRSIATAMSFPSYFGHNLDALYDCLTDLSWLVPAKYVVIWRNSDVLRQHDPIGYAGILDTLQAAARDNKNLTVRQDSP